MELAPSRLQLRLVAAGYAAVVAASALLIFWRYLQYVWHPQDAAQHGGMWAGGDMMLGLFICFMFLWPTVALVFVIRKSESFYTTYAKVLIGLSVTGPLAIGSFFVPLLNQGYWGDAIFLRVFAIPIVAGVLIFSRSLASFARARRLISYALLIEGLTFVAVGAGLFLKSNGRG
jgi:hypothetical protein